MAYDNLGDFLSELEDAGELVRISAEVDAALEIAEVTDRLCKSPGSGPALYFENVHGASLPVVTNLLGSRQRMCRALGIPSLEALSERIAAVLQPDLPEGWLETLRLVPQFASLAKLPPKMVKTAVCQQVVKMGRDVDLGQLPVPRSWPDEAHPVITAGQVCTRDPLSGRRNITLAPLEVIGRDALRVHWNVHHDAWRNLLAHRERSLQMPVAIALGGDPVLPLMAATPLPSGTDGYLFAGFLRGRSLDLVKCRSCELEVPANAEIVIEGYIDSTEPLELSPGVGSATGFYSLPEPLPVVRITAVTHRSNPVFPAMISGRPPMEDHWIGRAVEQMFLPIMKLFVPELVDCHSPQSGVFRNLVFVSIRKEYPQQARKVMNALWGLGWLMTSKIIVAVEADIDVHDEEAVWFEVGANVHPGRDTLFCEGPTHMGDHAAPVRGLGHKLGIDATRKLPYEGHPRPWPAKLRMTAEVRDLVTRRWAEYGLPPLAENER